MTEAPYIYRRRIHWGDTDAAGIAYTGKFLDFILEAVECWWRDVIGLDWYRLKEDHDMGSPMVHASLDFYKPVYDGDLLELKVIVENLGGASITHRIDAFGPYGVRRFEGKLVGALIKREPMRSTRFPEDWREIVEKYQAACET